MTEDGAFRTHHYIMCALRLRRVTHPLWLSGTVQLPVQLKKTEWERARLTNGLLSTLRIVYDPFDDTNWVLPETAMGEGVNRCLPIAITVLMVSRRTRTQDFTPRTSDWSATLDLWQGIAMVFMSCVMIIDGFHCGPHFWGFHECCDDCYDWIDIQSEPLKQYFLANAPKC